MIRRKIKCKICKEPIPKTPECYLQGGRVCKDCYSRITYHNRLMRNRIKRDRKAQDLEVYDELIGEGG